MNLARSPAPHRVEPPNARGGARAFLLAAAALCLAAMATPARAFDPAAGDFSRDNPGYIRLLSYNCLRNFPAGTASENAAFNRILTTISPDVVVFQEIDVDTTAGAIQSRLNALLGGNWSVQLGQTDGFIRCALCSRFTMSSVRSDVSPESDVRGVLCGLVNLPNGTHPVDLYVMGVHLKAGGAPEDDDRRQVAADAMAKWFGDLRTPGGSINLPANTPAIALGDFNFNASGTDGPHDTLIAGDILDNATYGPDIKGDWDGSDLMEALPADVVDLDFDTFPSSDATPNGRLDRFYYTDSVMTVAQSFVLNSLSLSAGQLSVAGLQSSDTETASDHLPVAVDLAIAGVELTEPVHRGLYITELIADPDGDDNAREWFEVYNPGPNAVDMNGWIIRDQGSNFHRIANGGPLLVAPRSHAVLGRNASMAVNDGVALDYAYGSSISLSNTGIDTLELYRGSVKVDGVRYNGGDVGQGPPNIDWGSGLATARSRGMTGNYGDGPTDSFAEATSFYSATNRGTPGGVNDGGSTDPATSAGFLAR